MSGAPQPSSFFIGWDVGGWNCDKNNKSRDALVILNSDLDVVGKPWRGNLRTHINKAATTSDWLWTLFSMCAAEPPACTASVTLAIDTPLGFSEAFVRLATDLRCVEPVESSDANPYLFRQTERFLFQNGLTPLSAIKDMIGSQATKGMHVLAKFAPHSVSCGVWTDGATFTALEAYPSACKRSAMIQTLRKRYAPLGHEDEEDALICALIAHLYAQRRETLASPGDSVPMSEGWIWVPRDGFRQGVAV